MRENRFIVYAFILSFIYWGYLFVSTTPDISFDAMGYQRLGSVLSEKGLYEYLQTGPQREPLYPFIVAIAMRTANGLGVSYLVIQKIFQILILVITQWFSCLLLSKLKVQRRIIFAAVLYLGFSPAIVNSAFSLYSEIATYPFILAIILVGAKSWECFGVNDPWRHILNGLWLALLFTFIVSVKAVFEVITPLFFIPYFCMALCFALKKQRKAFLNVCLLIFTAFSIFQAGILFYKQLNLKYNGHFALTDRGPWAFYGNTARRAEKMTSNRILAAFAYTAGEGACRSIFGETECEFWSYVPSDNYGISKTIELENSHIPKEKIGSTLVNLAKEKIFENPLQYLLFMVAEGSKMFFWESTRMGYVAYPLWLQNIFDSRLFKNSLRFFIFAITFFSCLCLIRLLWRNRSKIFDLDGVSGENFHLLFLIIFLIFIYISVHSFFFILARYALPIAPLYIVIVAYSIHNMVNS